MVIVVDKFEPKSMQVIGHVVQPIWVDIIVQGENGKVAIERKSVSDFQHSLTSGRIWSQIDRLKQLRDEEGYKVMIVIHGYLGMLFKNNRLSKQAYAGFLASCIMNDIPVYYVPDMGTFNMLIYSLNKHVEGEHKARFVMPKHIKKKGRTPKKEAMDVLVSFQGIGEKAARKLLSHYGSLKNVFEADDLDSVISSNIAKHIRNILEYDFNGDDADGRV